MADDEDDTGLLVLVSANTLPSIQEVYALISVDENGKEAICSFGPFPAVFANPKHIAPMMKKMVGAMVAAGVRNRKLRLIKFTGRETVEDIPIGRTQ